MKRYKVDVTTKDEWVKVFPAAVDVVDGERYLCVIGEDEVHYFKHEDVKKFYTKEYEV